MSAFRFSSPSVPTTVIATSTTAASAPIVGMALYGSEVFLHNTGASDVQVVFFPTGQTVPTISASAFQLPAGAFLGPFSIGDGPMSVTVKSLALAGTLRVTTGSEV